MKLKAMKRFIIMILHHYIHLFVNLVNSHQVIPTVIRDFNDNSIDIYNGLVYCKVLPPCDLYTPVLPIRLNGKIIFHFMLHMLKK